VEARRRHELQTDFRQWIRRYGGNLRGLLTTTTLAVAHFDPGEHIRVLDGVEMHLVDLCKRSVFEHRCVVDEDAGPAERCDRPEDGGPDLGGLGKIPLNGRRASARRFAVGSRMVAEVADCNPRAAAPRGRAIPAPIPLEAPITRATLPARSRCVAQRSLPASLPGTSRDRDVTIPALRR
jgi:hypothetical protein